MDKSKDINNTKISSSQISKLLYLYSLGSAILVLPTMITIISKQNSWIALLIVAPFQILTILLYIKLSERFPAMTFNEYTEKLVGVWIGRIIVLFLIYYFFTLSSLVLNNITEFINLAVLPITPPLFINLTFMLVVLFGVFLGIETIARLGEILIFWIVVIIIFMVIALVSKFDFHLFEPVLYEGWEPVIRGVNTILGFPVAEYIFLTMLLPMVKEEERSKLKKNLIGAASAITITSIMLIVLLQGVLGIFETSRSRFAIFDMAKNIHLEEIIVRVEVLVALMWIGSSFMKLVLVVYVLCLMVCKFFKIANYRPTILPICLLIIPLSMGLYRNVGHARTFSLYIWSPYSIIHGIILPVMLYIIAVLFYKKKHNDDCDELPELLDQGSS